MRRHVPLQWEFCGVTFVGPPIDDAATFDGLPQDLRRVLVEVNGFVAFGGGLHVRGACREPRWHALRHARFAEHYPGVLGSDVAFAEDAVGDQWLLRDGEVLRLHAEFGRVEPLGIDLEEFLARAETDPVETLGLHPLLRFESDGGKLSPGELLSVIPPFCFRHSEHGVILRAVPAWERLGFLTELARRISR
jgi:hypothetical protein